MKTVVYLVCIPSYNMISISVMQCVSKLINKHNKIFITQYSPPIHIHVWSGVNELVLSAIQSGQKFEICTFTKLHGITLPLLGNDINIKTKLQYLFDQTLWLLFFAVCFSVAINQEWLLFEGRVYFVGKPVDSNDGWIRYMRTLQLGLIDVVSSMHSLSIPLSAMETSLRTQTV